MSVLDALLGVIDHAISAKPPTPSKTVNFGRGGGNTPGTPAGETDTGAGPPAMVNVSWSNHQVPYSESLQNHSLANAKPYVPPKPTQIPQAEVPNGTPSDTISKTTGGLQGGTIPFGVGQPQPASGMPGPRLNPRVMALLQMLHPEQFKPQQPQASIPYNSTTSQNGLLQSFRQAPGSPAMPAPTISLPGGAR